MIRTNEPHNRWTVYFARFNHQPFTFQFCKQANFISFNFDSLWKSQQQVYCNVAICEEMVALCLMPREYCFIFYPIFLPIECNIFSIFRSRKERTCFPLSLTLICRAKEVDCHDCNIFWKPRELKKKRGVVPLAFGRERQKKHLSEQSLFASHILICHKGV